MRLPAFIRWQGFVFPRKSSELISALDLVPTVMTLVGGKIDANETLHGIDLSKTVILNREVSCEASDEISRNYHALISSQGDNILSIIHRHQTLIQMV